MAALEQEAYGGDRHHLCTTTIRRLRPRYMFGLATAVQHRPAEGGYGPSLFRRAY